MEKNINGFTGYTVNELGEVYSLGKKYTDKNGEKGVFTRRKLMKQGTFRTGYKRVTLINDDGKRKTLSVHRLVANAFIENNENKPQVNHIDGNKENNNVANLEWATRKENMTHAFANKLIHGRAGENHHSNKLTEAQVRDMITEMANGANNNEIGNKYNLHPRYVSLIRSKKRWRTVWDTLDIDLPKSNKIPEYKPRTNSKLPIEDQISIIKDLSTHSNIELAKKYNLDPSVISRVRAGKTWHLAHNVKRLSKS